MNSEISFPGTEAAAFQCDVPRRGAPSFPCIVK
jgi:hypothetical protein